MRDVSVINFKGTAGKRRIKDKVCREVLEVEKTVSGNPITITDAMPEDAVSLSAEIDAVQDLHGQSAPYVGGAGKNKLPLTLANLKAINTSGTWSGNVYTYLSATTTVLVDDGGNVTCIKVNGTPSANFNFILAAKAQLDTIASGTYPLNGCPVGGATDGSTYYMGFYAPGKSAYDFGSGTNISLSGNEDANANVYIRIASGYTAENKEFYPMIRNSGESATFAPYSNICPISGRDSVAVNDHGKNVLPNNIVDGTVYGITYTKQSDGSVKINGTSTGNANRTVAEYHLQNGTWIVSKGQANSLFGLIVEAYNNNTWVKVLALSFSTDEVQFTVDNNGYNKIRVTIGAESGRTANNLVYYPMIRSASDSDPTYAPFVANADVTIQLGQTVYGGSLNLTTGVLTVTHKGIDMGDLTWNYDAGTVRFYSGVISDIDAPSGDVVADVITEQFKATYASGQPAREDGTIAISVSGAAWVYNTGSGTDKTAFASLVDGHMMVYKLATPITIQLTPEQLTMLKGYNRLSCDGGGDMSITYKADRLAAIEAALAALATD